MPSIHPGNKKPLNTAGIFKIGMKNYDYVCETLNRMTFIRIKLGMTRADLSCVLNKADNYISHLESRKIALTMELFATFLRFFHIHPSDFFSDKFYTSIAQEQNIQQLKKLVTKQSIQIEQRKLKRKQSKKEV